MFKVRTLAKDDFPYAVNLANTMNWDMATEDFEFASMLEPDGCFVLVDDSKRLGIATCVSYGEVGWFGNLIVEEAYRRQGAGATLVKHAVNYLHGKGVETVGLYAYPNLVSFYRRLGFKLDKDFSVLHVNQLGPIGAERLQSIGRQELAALRELDSRCFGGDRRRLLQSILLEEGNLGYYVSEGNELVGYVAATVYEKTAWVGPLICQNSRHDIARSLIKAVLSKLAAKSVYAVVPKPDVALLDMFLSVGFKEEFFVSRMFLGKATAQNCIHLAESLERG